MSSVAARTPADVLRLIFELLDQPDVLASAAVSRTWRATASLDHSYYRACAFVIPPPQERPRGISGPYESDILRLVPIVRDAERCRYKISLTLRVLEDLTHLRTVAELEETDQDACEFIYELVEDTKQSDVLRVQTLIAPVVQLAIPHLVRLDIHVSQFLASALLDALDVPAPNLRDLSIYAHHFDEHEDPGQVPPSGLFAGHAPLLESVNLSVFLRATHADAEVGAGVLQALAHAFGGPRIFLKNGLSALADVSDTARAARNTADSEFFHSARTARVEKMLQTAAKRGDRVHGRECPHFRLGGD
ncbi:hypothetical protein AURDEDRAFT_123469 [Auricularia subglabra TFB-10046 SS5]|nr:hypothetical protein AURDEDRAFT_123469 [Auricularia subglabra TFB-10046 SS5]